MDDAISWLRQQRNDHLGWAIELCRIPSISTQDKHKDDVRKAVEWTRGLCGKLGFKAQIFDTERHPILYAEWCHAPAAPTYLVYGHVDVQPEGDRDLWDADPFQPYVKDGWLYGRGAADNKGPLLVYLRAAQAWLETHGRLPVNLKLLIEGEEEIGSPNLGPFVEEQQGLLKCDGVLISDTGLFRDGWPTITTGTRGIVYKEIWLSGPEHDLHSGDGGPVTNPANALARIIASLHDEQGRVNIPGFYDDVLEPSAEQRAQLAKLPFDEREFAEQLGVPGFAGGEEGWSIMELMTLRPTLDVNGIYGGYTDHGASTIIPATAGAKISMRIVPNQSGRDVGRKFDQAVQARCPKTVRCAILDHACAEPYVTPLGGPALTAAERALREAFNHEVAFVGCGGTLPILPMFRQHLGADSVLMGFAGPQCNAHGPNEKVNLTDLDRGAEAVARIFANLSRGSATS